MVQSFQFHCDKLNKQKNTQMRSANLQKGLDHFVQVPRRLRTFTVACRLWHDANHLESVTESHFHRFTH